METKQKVWADLMVALDEQSDPTLPPSRRARARRRCRALWAKVKKLRRQEPAA